MPATRACVSSAYTYVYVLYNVKSGGRQRERHEHTSSAVGGCYIVVARLSVEGPLSNRFDDGWRASSAHCNAVTCPRTKIFTNYRIKMEIAHKTGKKMTRKGTNRANTLLFFTDLSNPYRRLSNRFSRRWQFLTLRDTSSQQYSTIRVLID